MNLRTQRNILNEVNGPLSCFGSSYNLKVNFKKTFYATILKFHILEYDRPNTNM